MIFLKLFYYFRGKDVTCKLRPLLLLRICLIYSAKEQVQIRSYRLLLVLRMEIRVQQQVDIQNISYLYKVMLHASSVTICWFVLPAIVLLQYPLMSIYSLLLILILLYYCNILSYEINKVFYDSSWFKLPEYYVQRFG